MYLRVEQEIREDSFLVSYALKNIFSKGRIENEEKDPFRTEYARDRDRILHTKAFRRLKGKTQVFVASTASDHFRSRLTHTIEVAQVARTIAKALGANEDVVEAVALAHDLGHTPFGHAGQDMLAKKMAQFGEKFEHNAQSRRILETIEPQNLTHEVLLCLCKHPTKSEKEKYNLAPQNFLEGQIVDIADNIAYTAHDIQDGLESEILSSSDVDFIPKNILHEMVSDIIFQAEKNLENCSTPADIRNSETLVIHFSKNFSPLHRKIQSMLMNKFYRHRAVLEQVEKGEKIISEIFDFLIENPKKIPKEFVPAEDSHVRIKDFIAGMTDRFAERFYIENVE